MMKHSGHNSAVTGSGSAALDSGADMRPNTSGNLHDLNLVLRQQIQQQKSNGNSSSYVVSKKSSTNYDLLDEHDLNNNNNGDDEIMDSKDIMHNDAYINDNSAAAEHGTASRGTSTDDAPIERCTSTDTLLQR